MLAEKQQVGPEVEIVNLKFPNGVVVPVEKVGEKKSFNKALVPSRDTLAAYVQSAIDIYFAGAILRNFREDPAETSEAADADIDELVNIICRNLVAKTKPDLSFENIRLERAKSFKLA